MAIRKIEVCDSCEDMTRPVKKYRIGTLTQLNRVALCDPCVDKKPLRALLKTGAPKPGYRVTPLAEVAAKKSQQKEVEKDLTPKEARRA